MRQNPPQEPPREEAERKGFLGRWPMLRASKQVSTPTATFNTVEKMRA